MKRLFIIGAMAATPLLAAGCGAGTIVNQPSTPTPQTSASATPAAAAAHVGAALTLNGTDRGEKLQITFVKMVDSSKSASQYFVPAAGMREIALEFRYKNVGTATYSKASSPTSRSWMRHRTRTRLTSLATQQPVRAFRAT